MQVRVSLAVVAQLLVGFMVLDQFGCTAAARRARDMRVARQTPNGRISATRPDQDAVLQRLIASVLAISNNR